MSLTLLTRRALNAYLKDHNKQQNGKWHLTASEDIRTHADEINFIQRLKEKSKLSFMDQLTISIFDTFLVGSIVDPPVMCGQDS